MVAKRTADGPEFDRPRPETTTAEGRRTCASAHSAGAAEPPALPESRTLQTGPEAVSRRSMRLARLPPRVSARAPCRIV